MGSKKNYSSDFSKKILTPKYIALYVVLGVIVYGAIYFLFLHNSYQEAQYKNSNLKTGQNADDSVSIEKVWSVKLSAQNGSGEAGTAYVYDQNGSVKVSILMKNEVAGGAQPAHIHLGSCPNPGAVKFPLSNVVAGKSETVLNVTTDQLKKMEPLAINVHKSASEIGTYVACGDLK